MKSMLTNFFNKIEFPSNVQYGQMISLSFYAIIGWFVLDFYRPDKYIYLVAYTMILDFILNFTIFRKTKNNKVKFPVTGVVVGVALTLLLESYRLFTYLVAGTIAVFSKSLIQYQGKHVYNPANVAVLFAIAFLSNQSFVNTAQWAGSIWLFVFMLILGTAIATWANRIVLSFAYLFSFFLFSSIYSKIMEMPPLFIPGSMLGIPAILFSFHMITDPATSPNSKKYQIMMGVIIALLDLTLRHFKILYAPFLALFIYTSISPLVSTFILEINDFRNHLVPINKD